MRNAINGKILGCVQKLVAYVHMEKTRVRVPSSAGTCDVVNVWHMAVKLQMRMILHYFICIYILLYHEKLKRIILFLLLILVYCNH